MIASFTGTQQGMTQAQKATFRLVLAGIQELHLGDCVGADADAHRIAVELKLRTVGHPPVIVNKRAYCAYDETWEAKPYLTRNHDMVDVSGRLIATPAQVEEQLRSGTWATIRYAKKRRRSIYLIYPDGRLRVIHPDGSDS